ncbi:MAG: MBL fold metallo-hydrolase [Gammaproteobacteria bacterium]|nr:MBL fold metallo-hydrolase [Gammaproteobacteria bacterium]
MLRYQSIPVTPFQQNCSIIWCEDTRVASIIDPGGDIPTLMGFIHKNQLQLQQIWVTHAHLDHASGVATLAETYSLPIYGPHPDEQFWIDLLPEQAHTYGFPEARAFVPTRWLYDQDTVSLGAYTFSVRHCPGHTPGHVIFYSKDMGRAFVGDVLFAGSIGRTDFPRGDYDTLISSIKNKLWCLGDETIFISGHGGESSFGHERRYNPYVGGT